MMFDPRPRTRKVTISRKHGQLTVAIGPARNYGRLIVALLLTYGACYIIVPSFVNVKASLVGFAAFPIAALFLGIPLSFVWLGLQNSFGTELIEARAGKLIRVRSLFGWKRTKQIELAAIKAIEAKTSEWRRGQARVLVSAGRRTYTFGYELLNEDAVEIARALKQARVALF